MLIPQFTIRRMLAITAVFAVICVVGTFATRGQPWAVAITVMIGSLVLGFVSYLGFFVVAWVFAVMAGLFEMKQPGPPFVQGPSVAPAVPPQNRA